MEPKTVLKLPACSLNIVKNEKEEKVFDIIRKQYVSLTPEEWVRQHFVHMLVNHYNYPKTALAVEARITVNRQPKRFDILAYDANNKPLLVVECKRTDEQLTYRTLEQALAYNHALHAPYIAITNGMETICMKKELSEYEFTDRIPEYPA